MQEDELELSEAAPFQAGKTPLERVGQFMDYCFAALECDGKQIDGMLTTQVPVTELLAHDLYVVWHAQRKASDVSEPVDP